MITLLCIGILIMVLAAIVTVQAAVTAPEGYEDGLGFHVVASRPDGVTSEVQAMTAEKREIPPFAATR